MLRTVRYAAAAIPWRHRHESPHREWIDAHRALVQEFEIANLWIASIEETRRLHAEFAGTAAADDIAWFFMKNGLIGDCEGDVACYMTSVNRLEGEYLRWHPAGRHAAEALSDLARKLNGMMDNLQRYPKVLAEFEPGRHCGALHASLDPLRSAGLASTAPNQAPAIAALDRYARLCPAPAPAR